MNVNKNDFSGMIINSIDKNQIDLSKGKFLIYIKDFFIKLKNKPNKFFSPNKNKKKSDQSKKYKINLNIIDRAYTPDTNHSINNIRHSLIINTPDKSIKINDLDLLTVNKRLAFIFHYYCRFGERLNTNYLKVHNFYKLLYDAKLIDSRLTKAKVELIYTSDHKNKQLMTFDSFLSTLINISNVKYTKNNNSSQKLILNSLLSQILPLYDQIEENKNDIILSNESDELFNKINMASNALIIDNQTKEILESCVFVFYEIYKVYFPCELIFSNDNGTILEKSKKAYFSFLKSFDIMPDLVKKTNAFNIFQIEIETILETNNIYLDLVKNIELNQTNKINSKINMGKIFNFFKFLRTLIRISDICYSSVETGISRKLKLHGNIKIFMKEKFGLMLERMQLSKGFLNLEMKNSSTQNIKNSLIIPEDILDRINKEIFENNKVLILFKEEGIFV